MKLKGIKIYRPGKWTPGLLHGTLGHDGIADRGCRLGFRRAVIIHVAAFRLFLGGTIAESDLMRILTNLYDLEFIVAAGIQQSVRPGALAGARHLRLVALG